jgi:hypothetical protein
MADCRSQQNDSLNMLLLSQGGDFASQRSDEVTRDAAEKTFITNMPSD